MPYGGSRCTSSCEPSRKAATVRDPSARSCWGYCFVAVSPGARVVEATASPPAGVKPPISHTPVGHRRVATSRPIRDRSASLLPRPTPYKPRIPQTPQATRFALFAELPENADRNLLLIEKCVNAG